MWLLENVPLQIILSLNIPTEIPALIINLTVEPIWNVGLDHWVRYKSHTTAFPDQLHFLSHTGIGDKSNRSPALQPMAWNSLINGKLDKFKDKSDK